jgi:hypothetical protein
MIGRTVAIGFSRLPVHAIGRTIVWLGKGLHPSSYVLLCAAVLLGFPVRSLAQTPVTPLPPGTDSQVEAPSLENRAVERNTTQKTQDNEPLAITSTCTALTSNALSDRVLNLPSLWWLREQLAEKKSYGGSQIIKAWSACRGTTDVPCQSGDKVCRVDVEVNRQLWSLLDHLQRYELVSKLGYEFVNQFVDLNNLPPGVYRYNVQFFDRPPKYDAETEINSPRKPREIKPEALYECVSQTVADAAQATRLECQIGPENFVKKGWRPSS